MRRPTAVCPGQLSLLELCLDERDRAVLAFDRRHHRRRDVGNLVQQELGFSATRYFQLLLVMLERPEVAAADPELVSTLRAMRDRRRRR
jgi:hypothetical protein